MGKITPFLFLILLPWQIIEAQEIDYFDISNLDTCISHCKLKLNPSKQYWEIELMELGVFGVNGLITAMDTLKDSIVLGGSISFINKPVKGIEVFGLYKHKKWKQKNPKYSQFANTNCVSTSEGKFSLPLTRNKTLVGLMFIDTKGRIQENNAWIFAPCKIPNK